MSRWTEQDVENLRSGKNINYSNVLGRKPSYSGQPITATRFGETVKFDSVNKAHEVLGVPYANICAILNGRNARSYGYTFEKIYS